GSVFQTVWYIGVSAIRAAGDSRTPMWLAILSVCVTVPLAFLFIDVLNVGPIGAAYAIVGDGALICALALVFLWRGRADLTIRGGPWGIDVGLIRSIFAISLPSAAERLMFSVGILALSRFAFRLGTNPSADLKNIHQVASYYFILCIDILVEVGPYCV